MLFTEDDLLPLSALQHLVFCERQCGLIHVERLWADNRLTLEGSSVHGRVNEEAPRRELRRNLLVARRIVVRSFELGVSGVADVIEFHKARLGRRPREGVGLAGLPGTWIPFPVEYKRGRPKQNACDEVQLCAQAMCLEEMLGGSVGTGALFYGAQQHRRPVTFDADLREATRAAATRLHAIFRSGDTPRARREPKCRSCSLLDLCRPDAMSPRRSARRLLADVFRSVTEEEAP